MQSSTGKFLGRNVPPFRNNRPSSNHGKGRKKQNSANGICNNKMSFVVQRHNRKDRNEKPQSDSWKGCKVRGRSSVYGPNQGPMPLKKACYKENTEEILTNSQEHPNQHIMMRTTLTADCKWLLAEVLQENIKVFAWARSERTAVSRFVMEHQLKIYHLAEPVVHKKRPLTPYGRQALKESVFGRRKADAMPAIEKWDDKLCSDGRKGRNPSAYLIYELTITRNGDMLHPYGKNGASFNSHNKIPRDNLQKTQVKKFFGQGEQVQKTPGANEGETSNLKKELQVKLILTPRAWRLYLGKETIEEGSGVGIILVSPDEKMHSYAICLKFNASDHAMDFSSVNKGMKELHVFINSLALVAQIEGNHTPATKQERKYKEEIMDVTTLFHRFQITHLLKILNSKAETLTGLATIKLEFLNQEVSVGIKTRPSMEEISSNKKEKAANNIPGTKPNYNWETIASN
ncbi:reverse transcriptase domain-containing protein [Tanacetum coccineum]